MRSVDNANMFKFEVAPRDICVSIDGAAAVVERCELSQSTTLSFNRPYTVTYRLQIAKPGAPDASSAGWVVMGQVHQTPDGSDAGVSPMYARELSADATRALKYSQRTSQVDPIISNPTQNYFASNSSPKWGNWIAVLEQHYISPTTLNGYHKVYHDGVLVANYTGNTGMVDVTGPYYKFGIYRASDATKTLSAIFADWTIT